MTPVGAFSICLMTGVLKVRSVKIMQAAPDFYRQVSAGTGNHSQFPDEKNRKVFISFDGIYNNSEVWINGTYLGKRPNGYISFQYDLTPYLKFGKDESNSSKS